MTPHTPSAPEPDGPQDGHPDIEALADLAEELTDPADEPALRSHLAGCPECADTYAALAEVQALLGTVDTPPPAMPEDVARRIDAALAGAAGAPHPTARAAAGASTAPPAGPPAGSPRTPPGRADAAGPGRPSRPRRRRVSVLLAAGATAVVLGLGALFLPLSPSGPGGTAASSAARPAAGSQAEKPGLAAGGIQYQDDHLTAQIQELVRTAGTATTSRPGSLAHQQTAGEGPGTAGSGTPAPACAAGTTGVTDRSPLAVAPGHYRGTDVLALVYPAAGRTDALDVYLITPDCSAPGIVLHRTVPAS
ncbi:hypothetical protein [Kitasatospora paranensis]|uniref:Anti-sigma factor family protein n=1 Tax=Kitasatospora paranensis TaxID=258053 RepID=A0ABW2FWJ8_9ACTN